MIFQVKMLPSSPEICLKIIPDGAEDFVFHAEHCGVSSVFTLFLKYLNPSFLTPMAFPHPQTSLHESMSGVMGFVICT